MSVYNEIAIETFIIRVWRETTSNTCRGQIVRIGDKEVTHFGSVEQLLQLLTTELRGHAANERQLGIIPTATDFQNNE